MHAVSCLSSLKILMMLFEGDRIKAKCIQETHMLRGNRKDAVFEYLTVALVDVVIFPL